jgi:hypothetical protein
MRRSASTALMAAELLRLSASISADGTIRTKSTRSCEVGDEMSPEERARGVENVESRDECTTSQCRLVAFCVD